MRRRIPASRVAAFINGYIAANYTEDQAPVNGYWEFAAEVGVGPRIIVRICKGEQANVEFDLLDRILVALDRHYLWHWPADEGGFSDYYQDEPGPAAIPTPEQEHRLARARALRAA